MAVFLRVRHAVFASLALCGSSMVASAVASTSAVANEKTATGDLEMPPLTIGVSSVSPPYILSLEMGEGLDPDILRLIATKMGYEARFVHVPYARREIALREGRIDAVTFWSAPRAFPCHNTAPYRFWRNALISFEGKKAAEAKHTSPQRIGIFRGAGFMREEIEAAGISFEGLTRVSTLESSIRMLLHGRLDSFIGDYPSLVYYLQREQTAPGQQPTISRFFKPKPQAVCFAVGEKANAFDRVLAELSEKAPETLAEVTSRYGLQARITPPLANINN